MATKQTIKASAVPEPVLTLELFKKYIDRIKVRGVIRTNKHGGTHSDVYLDDGKSPDRKVEIEMTLYSKFGVSAIADKKTGELRWSMGFPLMKNGAELGELCELQNTVSKRDVFLHSEKIFGEKQEKSFVDKICKSAARKPTKKPSEEAFGSSFKLNIFEEDKPADKDAAAGSGAAVPVKKAAPPQPPVRYFIEDATAPNGRREVTRDEIKDREGFYTVRFIWTKVHYTGAPPSSYGSVCQLKFAMFHPEAEDDELFHTRPAKKPAQPATDAPAAANGTSSASNPSASQTDGKDAKDAKDASANADPAPQAAASDTSNSGAAAVNATPAAPATVVAPSSSAAAAAPAPASAANDTSGPSAPSTGKDGMDEGGDDSGAAATGGKGQKRKASGAADGAGKAKKSRA